MGFLGPREFELATELLIEHVGDRQYVKLLTWISKKKCATNLANVKWGSTKKSVGKKTFPIYISMIFSQQRQHDFRLPRLAHTRTLFHLIPTLSSRLHASCPAGLASAGKPFGCHPPTRTAFHSGVYSVLSFDLEKNRSFQEMVNQNVCRSCEKLRPKRHLA